MQLGTVIGHATATVKHPSMEGWRMLIVQMLGADRAASGDPVVAFSKWSPGIGQRVVLNCDGRGARELIGDPKSPVRWFIVGIEDETR